MPRSLALTSLAAILFLAGCQGGAQSPAAAASPAASAPAATQPAEPLEVVARQSPAPGVTVVTLANQLTVIVAENHNSPVVNVRSYVRAGGLYEGPLLGCGASHALEHLVAEGAEHEGAAKPKGQAKPKSDRIDRIGGQSNAYTTLDHTCYYISAAASKADDCIDLVADWMGRPRFSREDFARELGVTGRELEMGLDDPGHQIQFAHMQACYGPHPASVPVIGLAKPHEGLTHDDLLAYHKRMYVPQNMVFVVCGDVRTEAVLARVARQFAALPAGRQPELILPEVQPFESPRRQALTNKTVTECIQETSFQIVPLLSDDLYPLDVLSQVLTGGESSRLVAALKRRDKLVTGIGSSSWTPAWGKGLFTVSFRCAPASADAAEKALLAELKKVIEQGVTSEELAAAKRQKVAELVYSRQTVESQAASLGTDYLASGDVGFSKLYVDRIQTVTAEQVQAVARKYLRLDRPVTTRMLPASAPAATTAAPAGPSATRAFALPNGLKVVLHSTPGAGLASVFLAVKGGILLETPADNGIGSLVAELSTEGAGERSAEQIAQFFDRSGGSLDAQCGNNTFYWRSTVLSDSLEAALPIFADVVLRPTYGAKEVETLRPVLLARIRQADESWYGILNRHFRQDFFRDSPLALQPAGKLEVVAKAAPEQIAAWHKQVVKAGSSVLAVYGQFDPDAVEAQVRRLFAAMPPGENAVPTAAARQVAAGGECYRHAARLKGSSVIVAAPGMVLTNTADMLPMAVLDTLISGYQLPRGWLHEDLRGRQLVYVVHAYNFASLVPGAFLAYAQCQGGSADQVAGIIRQDMDKTLSYEWTQAELDEAVNIILTAELLDKQDMPALAMQAALDELYGLGYDFRRTYEKRLRAIAPADVKRVARKYLSSGYVTTIVEPEKPATASAPTATTKAAAKPATATAPT